MPPPEQSPSATLRRLANGFQVSQAIYVAATLGDRRELAAGPRSSAELAAATGATRRAAPAAARAGQRRRAARGRRRALLAHRAGECLRSDAPQPVGGWAAFVGRPYFWAAWGALLHSVRTGENAMTHVPGVGPWEYRAQRPEEGAIFDRAMTDLSRRFTRALLDAYDFSRFGTVVDVGGGQGALLAAILAAHPVLRGVLFDLPHVVAAAGGVLAAAGVADRCAIAAAISSRRCRQGGDAYVLRAVLHDWEDPEAIAILRSCRRGDAG